MEEKEKILLPLIEAADILGFTENELRLRAEVGRIAFAKREGNNYWFTYEALRNYERRKWLETNRWLMAALGVVVILAVAGGVYGAVRYQKRKQSGALAARAEQFMKEKKLEPAIQFLERAVEYNPDDMRARMDYARALELTGQADQEERQLRRILEKEPESLDALQSMGMLEFRKRKWNKAEEIFNKITKTNPDHFMGNYYLGLTYAQKGENGKAAERFAKVMKERPGFAPAELSLADVYAGESKLDTAMVMYKNQGSKDLVTMLNQAVVLQKKKNFDQAGAIYKAIIQNEPVIARAYNNLAWGMVSEGKPDEKTLKLAFSLARKAYLLNPEDGTAVDTLGWILYLAGQKQEALKQLEQASELEPKSVVILMHIAMVYMDGGDRNKALTFLTKAKEVSAATGGTQMNQIEQLIEKLK